MAKRNRFWEKSHRLIPLSPDNFKKLKKIKGTSTYDEVFGRMFKRLEEL